MPLIKLENLHLHYGEQIIFDDLSLQLDKGDRVGIIGRNGAGKSTLLKSLQGDVDPDSGNRWVDPGIRVAGLAQDLPEKSDITVYDFVAEGLPGLGEDLARYEKLIHNFSEATMDELGRVQQRIEAADGWRFHTRITQTLTRLGLDGEAILSSLSGGWRRRVALAQALVCEPDILLLDEPTNHLDIAAIQWLELQLQQFTGAIVVITHDRAFLRAVANKIGELDRGIFRLWDGDYDGFLVFKQQQLDAEERQNALFDKKLAQEEVWIRQGIKARRTRNEGRVRSLEKMRNERSQRRDRLQTATIEQGSGVLSGKLVAELQNVSFAWTETPMVKGFSSTIVRGDKIGLVGPNGIGKSTLLKLILGELEPTSGTVRRGTKLSVGYFDQMRDQLDLNKSALDNISDGRDSIEINGRSRHIISYLGDFLFTGERARTPIRALSGGERNRVLLAKLFSKPANLLVMDEPTNDLDAETLELLESILVEFDGTLLLVSHDREFLDNVVTSTIAFEGMGRVKEYIGGYSDWLSQGGRWPEAGQQSKGSAGLAELSVADESADSKANASATTATAPAKAIKKLSYKLQRELDGLPAVLEKLEQKVEQIQALMAAEDFYQRDQKDVNDVIQQLADAEAALNEKFERWEELEAQQNG
ncbi:ATP-binding cassette domain-containing protein [Teredinibacter waterburyi]|jgi:ATPase components of ABC transporters with duplicated ATPase domains|uniref:ATP-binding cassette domain-containing protein n=1 Tax=Teredinibacter waterburyi TaxID=1500538 RepID=UPI00165F0D79|nr:ATP-binding cassette domain-containing protein [Teredinibacter waterburyi]